MSLRVGIDFGTATTCVAFIRGAATLRPQLLPFGEKANLRDSKVWFDREDHRREIVHGRGHAGRRPRTVFEEAQRDFDRFWSKRVESQKSGRFETWRREEREADMLLSFFKPELADAPAPELVQVVSSSSSTFDPMTQSAIEEVEYSLRVIANPAPTTEDYIAGTASILRAVGRDLQQATGDVVTHLAIGIPSLSRVQNEAEYQRAVERRETALRLAEFESAFGQAGMTVDYYPEALAAARGIDPGLYQGSRYLAIIDVGAGTTDCSVAELRTDGGSAAEIGEELAARSHRFAGRDLNAVMATWLGESHGALRKAFSLLDGRAWQLMLDREMEGAKRAMSAGDQAYTVRLGDIAATTDVLEWDAAHAKLLSQPVICDLTLSHDLLDHALERSVRRSGFDRTFETFLQDLTRAIPAFDLNSLAIVLVGGGFLFPPFRRFIERALRARLGSEARIRFSALESHLQTSVAVGLARAAALREER